MAGQAVSAVRAVLVAVALVVLPVLVGPAALAVLVAMVVTGLVAWGPVWPAAMEVRAVPVALRVPGG